MNELKNCLKWLAIYCLLLSLIIIPNGGIIPLQFPTDCFSSIYVLFLSVCLILRYQLRLEEKGGGGFAMLCLAHMVFLLMLFRCIKYSIFGRIFVLGRYMWYAYYIPLLFIPMLLFFASLFVYATDEQEIKRKWGWVFGVTIALVLLVMTNDIHQWVFRFQPGFEGWDWDYSNGFVYPIATAWQYILYVAAIVVLLIKCSISKIKRQAWVILLPFAFGITFMLLIMGGKMPTLNGHDILCFPEVLCFMAAGVLECCMQLGLIPTNEGYQGLMKISSVSTQIVDCHGHVVFRSNTAQDLTQEQLLEPDNTRIGEHIILRRMEIPGGFGYWQNNVSELDTLNNSLAEVNEQLSEETEFIRLQNELKEKQLKIEQRTRVYDSIAIRTQIQSLAISQIAKRAKTVSDAETKDKCRKQIAILASYIKRYANLLLLSSESKTLSIGEFGLSVTEVLRYINLYGIPCELMNTAQGIVSSEKAIVVFESFESLMEQYLPELRGVYVYLSMNDDALVFKLTMENVMTDKIETIREKLSAFDIQVLYEQEDNVEFWSFVIPKGGDEE